jgi:hypothetical protein
MSRLKLYKVILISSAINVSFANINLTHDQVAVVYVKHSGLFNRHIDANFSTSDCVSLLQQNGIKMDWLDVIMKKQFTTSDMAQLVGQSYLLFSGKHKPNEELLTLPTSYRSWDELCQIHGLNYMSTYNFIDKFIKNLKNF